MLRLGGRVVAVAEAQADMHCMSAGLPRLPPGVMTRPEAGAVDGRGLGEQNSHGAFKTRESDPPIPPAEELNCLGTQQGG